MKVSEVMQEFVPCEICGNKNIKIYSSLCLSSRVVLIQEGCLKILKIFDSNHA